MTETTKQLQILVRQWQAHMRMTTAITNATKAYARSCVGFSTLADEATRTEIVKRANAMLDDLDTAPPHLRAFATVQAEAAKPHEACRKQIEKAIVERAEDLPAAVVQHVADTRGLGLLSLGKLVGWAGDFADYPNHRHLWKRFGLAPMNGKAMSTHRRDKSLSTDEWIVAGYSPERRAEVFVIGDVLIKSNRDGMYRKIYDERKQIERDRAEAAGLQVLPSAKIKKGMDAMSDGHVHKRAQRWMEKRLIKNLWQLYVIGEMIDVFPVAAVAA